MHSSIQAKAATPSIEDVLAMIPPSLVPGFQRNNGDIP
jgi:hypothetical protein